MLSEKASKHALYESEVRLNESYRPQISELDKRILSNLELIKQTQEHFNEFKELMNAEVHSAVKKTVIKEIKVYEHEKLKS